MPTVVSTPTSSSSDEPTTVSTCTVPQNEHLDAMACGLFYPQMEHRDPPVEGMSEYQQENAQTAGSTDLISVAHVQTYDHEAVNWPNPSTQVIPHDASYYPDPATRVPHEVIDKMPAYREAWHQVQLTATLQGESGGCETLDPSLDPMLMNWMSGWSIEELNQVFSFDPAWQGGGSGLDNDMLAASFSDMHDLENFSPSVNEVPTGPPPSAPADKDAANPDSSHEHVNNAPGAIQPRKPLSHVSCNISRPETATATIASTHKRKYLADKIDKENGATEDNNPARPAHNWKPAASKEVLTLTETGRGGHSTASWLTYAEGYLRSGEVLRPEWKDCIDSWLAFEQSDAVPVSSNSTPFQK